jgi:hypothetical protein
LADAKVKLGATVWVGDDDPRRLVSEALLQWLEELSRLHDMGVR